MVEMIKLKDLLKEAYAWERKFGEKLPTLADVQKKHLSEGKFKAKGKYLYMPDGEMSSIPKATDRDRLIIQVKADKFQIYTNGKQLVVYGRYMLQFKNLNELAKWLSKNKAKYIGID